MNILFLTTPAQHSYNNPSVAMDTKALKQWLSNLPTNNVLETVNQLREAIERFNETQIEATKRIKLLELYKETLDLILYSYDELRLRQLPIPDIQRKSLAEDIMWLYLGLSNGYKTVVLHSHQNQLRPSQDSKVLLAVYRAMELIIHALIYAFRSRHATPPLAYLELNQLYLFAEQDNALTLAVKGVTGHAVTVTIDVLFKQFMLLVAADPATIKSTQLYELHNALEAFTSHSTINNGYNTQKKHYQYSVDLMDDTAPQLANHANAAIPTDTSRTFDISPTLSDIESWLSAHATSAMDYFEEHESYLLTQYLSSVKNTWALADIDLPVNTLVTLIVGVNNIRYWLDETTLIQDISHNTITNKINNPEKHPEQHNSHTPHISADTVYYNWRFVSKHNNKIIVQGEFPEPSLSPSTGEIVGLLPSQQNHSNADIIIASIVSITNNRTATPTLELQVINDHAATVTCSLLDNEGRLLSNAGGLYFQRDNKQKKPASLLTPKAVIEHEHPIQVTVHGITYDVIPYTCIYENQKYVQFRFKAEKSKPAHLRTDNTRVD